MATPDILDFDALLAPVSEENPGGAELRDDSSLSAQYYAVKDARDSARATERSMLTASSEEADGLEPADWRKVKQLALEVLAQNSKDVWIAAWLIEALCREHGFAGLRDGFRLVREISERYWEQIHPAPDESDGYSSTFSQLAGLNGEDAEGALIHPINAIPLTAAPGMRMLTSADYTQAAELQQITETARREERIARGSATMEMFEKAVAQTPPEFFRTLYEDINRALDEFLKMTEYLDAHCGEDEYGEPAAPPSANIRRALEDCRDRVFSLARHVLESATDEATGEDSVEGEGGEMIAVAGGVSKKSSNGEPRELVTRDDAFRALLQVADFFRRTEPHSPVSYTLEQAVRWGRMSLPELIHELIPDESARADFHRRAGVPEVSVSDSGGE